MSRPFAQVDAFTETPFAGNPAAVFVLDAPADAKWMQLVAREMNLSETAFLHRLDGAQERSAAVKSAQPVEFALRWFTTNVEVDLCGHATLASAHWLWESGAAPSSTSLCFHTRSGKLGARRTPDGWIELDFPTTTPRPADDIDADRLAEALGAKPIEILRSRFDGLVQLDSAGTVRALQPDLAKLKQLNARGLIVTARSDDSRFDFISRFFAPQSGVDEDPVTGSAHCALGPYWSAKLGKTDLLAYQASARGGVVSVRVDGERVRLAGQAVTVLRGELIG